MIRTAARNLVACAQVAIASGSWIQGGEHDPLGTIATLDAALRRNASDTELQNLTEDLLDRAGPAAAYNEWDVCQDDLDAISAAADAVFCDDVPVAPPLPLAA